MAAIRPQLRLENRRFSATSMHSTRSLLKRHANKRYRSEASSHSRRHRCNLGDEPGVGGWTSLRGFAAVRIPIGVGGTAASFSQIVAV